MKKPTTPFKDIIKDKYGLPMDFTDKGSKSAHFDYSVEMDIFGFNIFACWEPTENSNAIYAQVEDLVYKVLEENYYDDEYLGTLFDFETKKFPYSEKGFAAACEWIDNERVRIVEYMIECLLNNSEGDETL